jgi:hypothetical protein
LDILAHLLNQIKFDNLTIKYIENIRDIESDEPYLSYSLAIKWINKNSKERLIKDK